MALTITAWRLLHSSGASARCLVSQRDNRWQLIVWNRHGIAYCEQYESDDMALARSDELWGALIAGGWSTDASAAERPYRRTCLNCRRRKCVAAERHSAGVTLLCTACNRQWEDRERTEARDRRTYSRGDGDRRLAATHFASA